LKSHKQTANGLTGEKDEVADSLLEADELTVTLDDGAVEGLTEEETEPLEVVLMLAEIDALWLSDAVTDAEKLPLSFIEDDTLNDAVSLGVLLLPTGIDALTLPEREVLNDAEEVGLSDWLKDNVPSDTDCDAVIDATAELLGDVDALGDGVMLLLLDADKNADDDSLDDGDAEPEPEALGDTLTLTDSLSLSDAV
jgi:hypothetical protein